MNDEQIEDRLREIHGEAQSETYPNRPITKTSEVGFGHVGCGDFIFWCEHFNGGLFQKTKLTEFDLISAMNIFEAWVKQDFSLTP